MIIGAALASVPAQADQPPMEKLARLFAGEWRCSGHFANGKAIASSESFAPILKGAWLAQEHRDDPPFGYAAHALWGWDGDQKLYTLTIFDVSGGQRLFTSPGWREDALTFDARPPTAPGSRQERFVYRSRSAGGYQVEYQVLDKTNTWKMGDVLECAAAAAAPHG